MISVWQSARKRLPILFCCAFTVTNATAGELTLEAPPNARKASASAQIPGLPTADALAGPMSNPVIGKTLMHAEADPPEITRGGGSAGLEQLFAARCRSVVLVANVKGQGKDAKLAGTGTGSIVTMDGYILTASHVIEGGDSVMVGIFPSCKPGAQPEFFATRVVRNNPIADLALLQLKTLPSDIAVMPLGSLDEVRTGSSVVIIGHPQQLLMSLSQGTVSAIPGQSH